jgi:hypothetical protein
MARKRKPTDIIQVNLRLPESLRQDVLTTSKKSGRSFNSELVHLIEQGMAKLAQSVAGVVIKAIGAERKTGASSEGDDPDPVSNPVVGDKKVVNRHYRPDGRGQPLPETTYVRGQTPISSETLLAVLRSPGVTPCIIDGDDDAVMVAIRLPRSFLRELMPFLAALANAAGEHAVRPALGRSEHVSRLYSVTNSDDKQG